MDYDRLTEEEALDILRNHDETDSNEVNDLIERGEIIEAADVLYWMDAFGDLQLAVQAQPLPKDLPDGVVEEITNYDVLGGWRGGLNEVECPVCNTEIYEFDWEHDYIYFNRCGDNQRHVEYIDDPAGNYWDTTDEHHILCQQCNNSRDTFVRDIDGHLGVKVFYGDHDSWYPFSYNSGVVRWDGESIFNEKCEEYNLRTADGEDFVRLREVAKAFAGATSKSKLMEKLGWTSIGERDLDVKTPGIRRTYRYTREILEKWASVTDSTETEPTHPDFDFPYIIENGRRIYFPINDMQTVRHHLIDQVLFEAGAADQLREHRDGGVEA